LAQAGSPAAGTQPLSDVDYAWLRMDEPANLMMINGVLVMDGPVDLERLRATVERRLLAIPRFHQRVVTAGGGRPRWEPDDDFQIEDHVQAVDLPAPGGDAELQAAIGRLIYTPLDPARPLWSFHLVRGYRGDGSALLGRLHHCIGDGVALMLVLLSITDLGAADPVAGEVNPFTELFCHPAPDHARIRALAERVMPEGMNLLLNPASAFGSAGRLELFAGSLAALARLVLRLPDPRTRFKGPLGVPKEIAWSEPLPVAEVKAVGQALGGTVNDVLLAAMAGALRHYLARHGEVPGGLNFRAAMPVNLRPMERMSQLGNEFGLVFLSLPVGIADPVERLAELRRRAGGLKRSVEPVVVYAILRLLGVVPRFVQRLVVKIFAAKTTAVMTNVPGPRETLYLAGRPVREIFFWVPQAGRVGIGISICSYAGEVRLGVVTDAGLVPDPEVLVAGFHEDFEELRRRAGRPPESLPAEAAAVSDTGLR
jgi:diacylglycerol O-acyltransferase / wax synthase